MKTKSQNFQNFQKVVFLGDILLKIIDFHEFSWFSWIFMIFHDFHDFDAGLVDYGRRASAEAPSKSPKEKHHRKLTENMP